MGLLFISKDRVFCHNSKEAASASNTLKNWTFLALVYACTKSIKFAYEWWGTNPIWISAPNVNYFLKFIFPWRDFYEFSTHFVYTDDFYNATCSKIFTVCKISAFLFCILLSIRKTSASITKSFFFRVTSQFRKVYSQKIIWKSQI